MEIKKVTQEDLRALKGQSLRRWSYTASKDMLTFMIPGKVERYLIFILCQSIKTDHVWIVENPKISKVDDFSIKIEDTDFEVVCEEVIFNGEYFGQSK